MTWRSAPATARPHAPDHRRRGLRPSARPLLADLARFDADVARGLASHMEGEEPDRFARLALATRIEGEEPSLRAARLGCGLLDRAGPALPEDVASAYLASLRKSRLKRDNARLRSGRQVIHATRECC